MGRRTIRHAEPLWRMTRRCWQNCSGGDVGRTALEVDQTAGQMGRTARRLECRTRVRPLGDRQVSQGNKILLNHNHKRQLEHSNREHRDQRLLQLRLSGLLKHRNKDPSSTGTDDCCSTGTGDFSSTGTGDCCH